MFPCLKIIIKSIDWTYRKSGTQDSKMGPETQQPQVQEPQDPQVGPSGGTLRWDPRVGH